MSKKMYISKDVYTAAMERVKWIFDEFENVFVCFSGGKDSGVLLNLALECLPHGRTLGLIHQDMESQYSMTTEYVTRTFQAMEGITENYWWCIPIETRVAISPAEAYWYTWDDNCPEKWARPMPQSPAVCNLANNPMGSYYKYRMGYKAHLNAFGAWYRKKHGGGKTCALVGMRGDESLHRYSAFVNKVNSYNGVKWTTVQKGGVVMSCPLYDWTVSDIWHANAIKGWDYNRIYDLFHFVGIAPDKMRVASPFNDAAGASLALYKIIDPATWKHLVNRVQGVNFGALYGSTLAMGYKGVSLPEGHTWKSYYDLLISTLPDNMRGRYEAAFGGAKDYALMCRCLLKQDITAQRLRHAISIRKSRPKFRDKWRDI